MEVYFDHSFFFLMKSFDDETIDNSQSHSHSVITNFLTVCNNDANPPLAFYSYCLGA